MLAQAAPSSGLRPVNFTVDGVARTALVYVPPGTANGKLPLVFVFHGHGGSSHAAEAVFGIDRLWPQAISIYPQGLDSPGRLTDPEGKQPGWQREIGDQGDRDLHFFDAMLAQLNADYPVDAERVYCTGHSNGGAFTFLLWLARPNVFAAVAPSSSAASYVAQLTPKPALLLGGRADPLVKFEWQERVRSALRKINGCSETGETWQGTAMLYPSKTGTPLVTFTHDGGHAMTLEEPGLIVKFFQEYPVAPPTAPKSGL
jgi:polyhydroxybutyrate depolymerase